MSFFKQLTVLECASVLAGPAAGALFAELGATVIKLEPLGGDVTRSWKLPSEAADQSVSAYFSCVNWGKQSLALDLSRPAGRALAQQIATRCDIVLANYKPGAAEKLGMDAATLRALHPALIYAHLTGYGHANPRTGYDALIQAESGFLYLNAHPGQPPVKLPVALMDLLAAHQLKEAVLVALLERSVTGQGDYLEVSLLQSALASLANQASNWLVAGHNPQPLGLEHPNIVPYGTLYTSRDGQQIMLAIGSDAQFAKLCALLGAPELAQNPAFARNRDRVQHRAPVHAALAPLIAQQPAQEFLAACWAADLPAGAVKDLATALEQPAAHEMLLHDNKGIKGLRHGVFHSQNQPWHSLSAPPELGQDSQAVLARYTGLSATEYTTLKTQGVVG
ncbi:MAG: CaiB/BaiF CoA transferase family protein [Candidatus Sericytochromatia bacterium]